MPLELILSRDIIKLALETCKCFKLKRVDYKAKVDPQLVLYLTRVSRHTSSPPSAVRMGRSGVGVSGWVAEGDLRLSSEVEG